MKGFLLLLAVNLDLVCGARPEALTTSHPDAGERASWQVEELAFDDMEIGQPPPGFTAALTGGGGPVAWKIVADPSARAGKVLAQLSTDDTDYRFPLCVLDGYSARDVSVSVRFQAKAGEVDRAGGVVARYRDASHYYVARANALEGNVRLYVVVDGKRKQFAGVDHAVSPGEWHTLQLDVAGARFAVSFDGERLFTAQDRTLEEAGKIGLWTKADSVTWFDDLRYGPMPDPSASAGRSEQDTASNSVVPVLEATIEMPGVKGRIDHMALDAARQQLFVAALGNDTLEVLDLRARKVLVSRPLREPQGVLYLADLDLIAVTSGKLGTLELYEGGSLDSRASVEVGADADNLRYDPKQKRLFVAYGAGALAVVDAVAAKVIGRIQLSGHPEAFQLDFDSGRAFVNVPDAGEVAIVDLASLSVLGRWPLGEFGANFPMAFLAGDGALAVGCRTPPRLLVRAFDAAAVFEAVALSGDVDDLYFDRDSGLLYAACGAGFLDVFERNAPGRLSPLVRVPTADGARTCLFAAPEKRLFVACPARERPARVLVFRTS